MLAIVVFIAATVALASVLADYLYGRFAERSLGPPSRALLPGADSPSRPRGRPDAAST